MDIIEFVKTANRICGSAEGCSDCPFNNCSNSFCIGDSFESISLAELEKAASIAEQWAKEHPIKTRQSEFLKMFPNAQTDENDNPEIVLCPRSFDTTWECRKTNCKSCRADFWNQEV